MAKQLDAVFPDSVAYRKCFRRYLDSVKDFKCEVLRPIRNKIVFHFTDYEVTKTIESPDFELQEYVFLIQDGGERGNTYYQLTDEVSLAFLAEELDWPDDAEQKGISFRKSAKLTEAAKWFRDCTEELMVEVLPALGWKVTSGEDPADLKARMLDENGIAPH